MEARVVYLVDYSQAVPILAQWLFQEWGHRSVDGTAEGFAEALRRRMNRDSLPLALVAIKENQPVGTASLKIAEMEIRPQYEHWLGTVLVHEDYRGRGIGSLLIRAAEKEASRLGVKDLYLYTRNPRNEALYTRLGWRSIERLMYQGRPAVIMTKRVAG